MLQLQRRSVYPAGSCLPCDQPALAGEGSPSCRLQMVSGWRPAAGQSAGEDCAACAGAEKESARERREDMRLMRADVSTNQQQPALLPLLRKEQAQAAPCTG